MHLFKSNKCKLNTVLALLLILTVGVSVLSGCTISLDDSSSVISDDRDIDTDNTDTDNSSDFLNSEEELAEAEAVIDFANSALYEMVEEDFFDEDLIKGEVKFDPEAAIHYGKSVHCLFDMPTQQMIFQSKFVQIPSSDDTELYLFILDTWQSEDDLNEYEPYASTRKGHTMQIELPYTRTYLFARFVPALKVHGEYVAVSTGKYIGNPEILAPNQEPRPAIGTKKGILLDPNTIGTEKLDKLNVKRVIYNIPLSQIIGESSNPDMPTIEFEYANQIYKFNTATVYAYDSLFTYLSEHGMYATAIILNDWNEQNPEVIHPLSRNKTSKSLYYAFNTEEEEGVRTLEATALFLAERYTSGWYGMVHDWVIANEINQQTIWNYMDTDDLYYYTYSFEKSFRIFYNAIRSRYASASVSFSIDHDWNDNNGRNARWFNGKELLTTFNSIALKGGNYDWNIAIHPYPYPLTRVNFWSEEYDMTENAKLLTIMNLSSITNIMEKVNFRNTKGNVRGLSITELGFTSKSGEKLQAAAFAYCYCIIDSNPYVDAFLMNRQTDAFEEMKTGLDFGVYDVDLSEKYIANVFAKIDTDEKDKYIDFMLNIINAESLEEALSWANP